LKLVLCGDFCQLPPVPDRIDRKIVPATFAFDSKCWYDCVGEPMKLTRVFRQKDECTYPIYGDLDKVLHALIQAFVDMLNEMRFGGVSPKTVRIFKGLSRDVHYVDGVEPTEL
jgi:ATP-dependent DNA helicase PIF1